MKQKNKPAKSAAAPHSPQKAEKRETYTRKIESFFSRVGYQIELFISILLIFVIVYLLFKLILGIYDGIFIQRSLVFDKVMADAFSLIIGIEFTRMLCQRTPDMIIEVMMFAVARQLIATHTSTLENLIGIIGVGCLFFVRKYLLTHENGGCKPEEDGTEPEPAES